MNKKQSNKVIISGLGISGLITASLLCKEKIKVECFEPSDISKFAKDQRTTAFLNPAIGVFKEIGIWEKIEPLSQPLKEMEIVDIGNSQQGDSTSVVFKPKEISIENFGYNVPNNFLRSELLGWLKKKKNFVLHKGDSIVDHYAFDDSILVKTAKGKKLTGNLLVSCEGKDSAIRQREKIKTLKASYKQLAMVFQVSHSKKHKDRTTEILDSGGPFTIIPLRTPLNQLRSTIVWMDNFDVINKAYSLKDTEFNSVISKKSIQKFKSHMAPCIEVVGYRQRKKGISSLGDLCSDFGGNVKFVLGSKKRFKKLKINNLKTNIYNNKFNQSVNGNTNTVYIDPLNSLKFVLNKLKKDKIDLKKNFYVFTGSTVGVVPILSKGFYIGKIDQLGSVKAKII